MTFIDLEGHVLLFETVLTPVPWEIWHVLTKIRCKGDCLLRSPSISIRQFNCKSRALSDSCVIATTNLCKIIDT